MKAKSIHFLRGGNVVSETSGVVIILSDVNPAIIISGKRLCYWLMSFPCAFAPIETPGDLPLLDAARFLITTLSQHIRLSTDSPSSQILSRGSSQFSFWLAIDDKDATSVVTALTCHILCAIQNGQQPSVETGRLWNALRSRFWNQTHAHLARAARQMGVTFYRLDQGREQFLQLGQGSRLRLCHETLTDQTPLFARAATSKQGLHALFKHRGVPLPVQKSVESLEQALAAAENIG